MEACMHNPFSKSDYSDEVQNVIKLGWSTPKAKEVKDPSDDIQGENLVSFPKAAYETDPHNKDLDAFWAEIRAKEISKILTEFGVHCIWEIGSGDGSAAIPLTNMGVKVICVEPLAAGAEYTSKFGIETFCSTLEQLNLPRESINTIGIFDVFTNFIVVECK
jgi:hypothetical protein